MYSGASTNHAFVNIELFNCLSTQLECREFECVYRQTERQAHVLYRRITKLNYETKKDL